MERKWLKLIPAIIVIFVVTFMICNEGSFGMPVFVENKNIEDLVKEIIESNQDKKINVNKNFDNKFIYLEFEKDDRVYSYFVNAKTGEEVDFYNYLKPGKKEEFEQKIKELLYLKYPKFIADVLNTENGDKTYQIKENELIIYYDNYDIEPAINEKLFLTVNYNEIKGFLDFTFLLNNEYENENGYNYIPSKKIVALTFDDGPSGAKTNKIVEILEQNKAHATFFMVGNKMESGASTIHNVLDKGNEIGSHSYAHKSMKRQKLEKLLEGEQQTKEIYHNITGKDLIYTRPPYGAISNKVKENLDTIFITWNLDTEDWLHRDKNYVVDYVMENVSDGDIILMHDLYDSTVEAVEELLPKLYAEGYQVVSVSELAKLKNRNLENHEIYRSLKEIQ